MSTETDLSEIAQADVLGSFLAILAPSGREGRAAGQIFLGKGMSGPGIFREAVYYEHTAVTAEDRVTL